MNNETDTTFEKDQYYIIRTDRAGVFYAQLAKPITRTPAGSTAELLNARKVHGWDGACAVEELALYGPQIQGGNNRWTVTVPRMEVSQVIQVLPVSCEAKTLIDAMPIWKIKK